MASTITGLSAGNAMQTEQFLLDKASGKHLPAGDYRLMLLNLANGAVTITQATTKKYADISTVEATSSAGSTPYVAKGIPLGDATISVSARKMSMTFTIANLTNVTMTTDAWAIINVGVSGVGAQTDPILAIGKFDVAKSPVLGALTITIPADVLSETASAAA